MAFDGSCPIQLPDREIGVSVEGEQHSGRLTWIANHETDQWLTVDCFVRNPAAKGRFTKEWRRLEQYPLLSVP